MAQRGPNLVAVGDNCLDVYLTKDVMTVGGNALNVAAHWRKAGCAARYFGAVGQDVEAAVILEEVEKAGLAAGDGPWTSRPTAGSRLVAAIAIQDRL